MLRDGWKALREVIVEKFSCSSLLSLDLFAASTGCVRSQHISPQKALVEWSQSEQPQSEHQQIDPKETLCAEVWKNARDHKFKLKVQMSKNRLWSTNLQNHQVDMTKSSVVISSYMQLNRMHAVTKTLAPKPEDRKACVA